MGLEHSIDELITKELERKEKRSLRDKLTREFLKSHPEVKSNPDIIIDRHDIPKGTSERVIRSKARFDLKQKLVRKIIRDQKLV